MSGVIVHFTYDKNKIVLIDLEPNILRSGLAKCHQDRSTFQIWENVGRIFFFRLIVTDGHAYATWPPKHSTGLRWGKVYKEANSSIYSTTRLKYGCQKLVEIFRF